MAKNTVVAASSVNANVTVATTTTEKKSSSKKANKAAVATMAAPAPVMPVIGKQGVAVVRPAVTRRAEEESLDALLNRQLGKLDEETRNSRSIPAAVLDRHPGLMGAINTLILAAYVKAGVLNADGSRILNPASEGFKKQEEWRHLVAAQQVVKAICNQMYCKIENTGTLKVPGFATELTRQEVGAVQRVILGNSRDGRPCFDGSLHMALPAIIEITDEHKAFVVKTQARWAEKQARGLDAGVQARSTKNGAAVLTETATQEEFRTYQRKQGTVAKMGDVLGGLLKAAATEKTEKPAS